MGHSTRQDNIVKTHKGTCDLCLGFRCITEVKASAQFSGSHRVLKVSVECADKVIAWNESKSDPHGVAVA